jgi:hypothetical protein
MAKSTFTFTFRADPAKFRISENVKREIADVVVTDVINRVERGQRVDGSAQKQNKTSTLITKRKLGVGSVPLVAQNKSFLRRASYLVSHTGQGIRILLTSGVDKIARFLERKGYDKWLGISKAKGRQITNLVYKDYLAYMTGKRK